jgi:hypothetical protein
MCGRSKFQVPGSEFVLPFVFPFEVRRSRFAEQGRCIGTQKAEPGTKNLNSNGNTNLEPGTRNL